jgi:phage tail sheath protein FI
MPVLHQLTTNTTFLSSAVSGLKVDVPIAIIGIAESATFAVNTITRIQKDSDLALLGGTTDNTILPEVKILQQDYGCNNIFVIRVAKGATSTDTENNIIGTEAVVKTGLGLLKDCFSTFRCNPELILIPGQNSAAIVTKAIDVCNTLDAFCFLDFALGTTTAIATTARGTTTGLGTKSARLHPCIPRVKRDAAFESLATHAVGVTAKSIFFRGFGFTASNELLAPGINGLESGFNLSYTDTNADNQKLENLGCVSVNLLPEGYVLWGNRNALFVANTNETIDTYSVIQRVKQKISRDLMFCSNRFLDEDCTISTARLLESALNNVISSNFIRGSIRPGSRAVFNESSSDFNSRKLVYDIMLASNLPVELIVLNSQFSVQL